MRADTGADVPGREPNPQAASAAPVQPLEAEVIVIGAGPGGLTAALYLARFRRSVIVIDAGGSRVESIPRSHNYPGFVGGIPGHSLLATLREQLERYPVQQVRAKVRRIERMNGEGGEPGGLRVHWDGGSAQAQKVLLATGLRDVEPDMPHLRDALAQGLLRYCPVCDAYEAVNQHIGVYGRDEAGIGEAIYLRHFSPHVTLFCELGGGALDAAAREQLRDAGVAWVEEPVEALLPQEHRVVVKHGPSRTVCDTLYCALGVRVHSDLAQSLGAEVDETGYLQVDAHQATTVPGLYAVGDVSQGLNQIAVAAGGAAIAASAIHRALG